MPGPAPKHPSQRVRRNATLPMTQLPAEGRKGKTPPWPLSRARKAETTVWEEVWKTPQSVAWERLGWVRVVARYVRSLVDSEATDAPVNLLGEVRQLEDRLGLTPMSMMRLRWEISSDEVEEKRDDKGSKVTRLRAVDADALAGS